MLFGRLPLSKTFGSATVTGRAGLASGTHPFHYVPGQQSRTRPDSDEEGWQCCRISSRAPVGRRPGARLPWQTGCLILVPGSGKGTAPAATAGSRSRPVVTAGTGAGMSGAGRDQAAEASLASRHPLAAQAADRLHSRPDARRLRRVLARRATARPDVMAPWELFRLLGQGRSTWNAAG